jgi:hypothetical protein
MPHAGRGTDFLGGVQIVRDREPFSEGMGGGHMKENRLDPGRKPDLAGFDTDDADRLSRLLLTFDEFEEPFLSLIELE